MTPEAIIAAAERVRRVVLIAQLREGSVSPTVVARTLGVHRSTIARWARAEA